MIKGKLIGLRAIEKEDLSQMRDWRNIEKFRRNFREFRELNLINQENWFARVNSSLNDFMFLIVRLHDNKPIGACGLLYINWVIRSADFSFYIGLDDMYIDDKGYAKEAAQLLIKYGFHTLNLHKIWMELFEFDKQKLLFFLNEFNFHRDGILRDNCFEEGVYYNSIVLSLLASEFSQR
jgi:RimJ/RimL family protein N-acetyltransferase